MNSTFGSPYSPGSSLDQLYQKYHDSGFVADYFLQYQGPQTLFGIINILLNLSFIFVSIKSRSKLHTPFNFFIAFDSFSSILIAITNLASVWLPLSGQNIARIKICILLQSPGYIGGSMQGAMMVLISLERLICILFPVFYRNKFLLKWKHFYIFTVLLLDAAFGGIIAYLVFSNTLDANHYYLCNFFDFLNENGIKYLFLGNMFVEILSLFIYAIILFLLIKARIQRVKLMDTKNMQILRSLNVIMGIIIFGWLINAASPFYVSILQISEANWLKINPFIASVTILASALNGPVLFALSQEYRKCYQCIFPWLLKRSQTQPTIVVQVISSNACRRQQEISPIN